MVAIPALNTNNSDLSARIVNTILLAAKINKSESMLNLQACDCTTTAGGVQIDDLENWKILADLWTPVQFETSISF